MRELERADGFDGECERFVSRARGGRLADLGACGPQRPQYLGAIEALSLTVVAETHGLSRVLAAGASRNPRTRMTRFFLDSAAVSVHPAPVFPPDCREPVDGPATPVAA